MEIKLIRYSFAFLFIFEFLNSIKILNFSLHFPWLALALSTLIVWLGWEKIFRKNLYFPKLTGGIFAFHLYSDSLGSILKFYAKFNWYDKFTHLSGGAAIGTAVFLILRYLKEKNNWKLGKKSLIIFSVALALSLCVFYEFFEYFVDANFGYPMVIGKYDTPRDLLIDFLGITFIILLLNFLLKPPQSE